jgi:hypothetical protein
MLGADTVCSTHSPTPVQFKLPFSQHISLTSISLIDSLVTEFNTVNNKTQGSSIHIPSSQLSIVGKLQHYPVSHANVFEVSLDVLTKLDKYDCLSQTSYVPSTR